MPVRRVASGGGAGRGDHHSRDCPHPALPPPDVPGAGRSARDPGARHGRWCSPRTTTPSVCLAVHVVAGFMTTRRPRSTRSSWAGNVASTAAFGECARMTWPIRWRARRPRVGRRGRACPGAGRGREPEPVPAQAGVENQSLPGRRPGARTRACPGAGRVGNAREHLFTPRLHFAGGACPRAARGADPWAELDAWLEARCLARSA